jgi:hypothetical protein
MKLKQIIITFNDDTNEQEISNTANLLSSFFLSAKITAVILAQETEEKIPDVLTHDEYSNLIHLSNQPDIYEHG